MTTLRSTSVDPAIGATFKAAREGAGVTRRAVARAAEVDHSFLARFEAGTSPVSRTFYANVVRALAYLVEEQRLNPPEELLARHGLIPGQVDVEAILRDEAWAGAR